MSSVLCVGAATWDIVLKVERFPSMPTKVLATDCVETSAGMATSAAIAIAALGGQASIYARIGADHNGTRWLDGVRGRGVDTSLVETVEGARSGVSAIVVDASGERLIVPFYDAALRDAPPRVTPARVRGFDAVLVDTRWPDAARHVLACARAEGRPAVLDADVAPPEVLRDLVPLATHVVFSSEALAQLARGDSPAQMLNEVSRHTDAVIGVTRGAAGCTLLLDGGPVSFPAPAVRAVDTLAAGDVFHGAFALAIAEGRMPADAARFANTAAALKCERFGGIAGTPTRSEVECRLALAP